MPRPRNSAMSPADLERVGQVLFGPVWKQAMSVALKVPLNTIQSWASGRRGIPAGIKADLAALLRQRAREATELAELLESPKGLFHGLTRRELAFIGWATAHEFLIDEHWLTKFQNPAEVLANRIERELNAPSVSMEDGEADRLRNALSRLTDDQALKVVMAARDVDDLTGTSIPED